MSGPATWPLPDADKQTQASSNSPLSNITAAKRFVGHARTLDLYCALTDLIMTQGKNKREACTLLICLHPKTHQHGGKDQETV